MMRQDWAVTLMSCPKQEPGIILTRLPRLMALLSHTFSCHDLVLSCTVLSNCAALRLVTFIWLAL
eukprot:603072-Ditylum_brightwellii.AAC.1